MAGKWVSQARAGRQRLIPLCMPRKDVVHALHTQSVAATFFPAALHAGVVLYEPFGGICAGLEMVLKAGIRTFSSTSTLTLTLLVLSVWQLTGCAVCRQHILICCRCMHCSLHFRNSQLMLSWWMNLVYVMQCSSIHPSSGWWWVVGRVKTCPMLESLLVCRGIEHSWCMMSSG
jgi:hypothetical protein